MHRPRIGELLSKMVPLDRHDVDEILHEQSATRRRFGEIALAWGLCQPEHIWNAWWHQLSHFTERVDLLKVGIDAQATDQLPAELAMKYRAVPIRSFDTGLLVAVAEDAYAEASQALPRLLEKSMRFVIADGKQIDEALNAYYPTVTV